MSYPPDELQLSYLLLPFGAASVHRCLVQLSETNGLFVACFVHLVSEKNPMWPKVVIILRYV